MSASSSSRQEREPASTDVVEVRPGIFRLQLPITLPGLGHVNCYALPDARGITLIDPGLPDPGSHAELCDRLARIDATPDRVHTVIITHSHPDHFGGAGRLRRANGAEVVAHRHFSALFDPREDDLGELADIARRPDDGFDPVAFADALLDDEEPTSLPVRRAPWGSELSFPSLDEIRHMRTWDLDSRRGFITPNPTARVDDGDTLVIGERRWRMIHTPGHTGDHLCLFDEDDGTLLSGDHVLPTITPHISGMTPSSDALADFFDGLDRVARLDGVTMALPAHGHPFDDVAVRAADIAQHHRDRLDTLVEIGLQLGESDVVAISHELFLPRSWGSMAESETYAHLEHLRLHGRAHVRRVEGRLLYSDRRLTDRCSDRPIGSAELIRLTAICRIMVS